MRYVRSKREYPEGAKVPRKRAPVRITHPDGTVEVIADTRTYAQRRSATKHSRAVVTAELRKLVRERDKVCQAAGQIAGTMRSCGGILHCSHIKSVGAWKNLQFHPLNAVALCYRHHIHFWHHDTTEADAWIRRYLGSRYEDLQTLKLNYTLKGKTPDDLYRLWRANGLPVKKFFANPKNH